MDDKQLKRAGLDYHEIRERDAASRLGRLPGAFDGRRIFALSPRAAQERLRRRASRRDDVFVFGSETAGLPRGGPGRRSRRSCALRLPMRPGNRSLNLSNAVAVVVYEAWRQLGFG